MRDRSREYRHVTDGQYYRRADDSMQYKRNEFPGGTDYVEYVNEKENNYLPSESARQYRSRSPNNYVGQQTRQYQYQARLGVTPVAKQ
jgi:hypothetical protein